MVKIFHEAPNSIFGEVQKVTDGDYALVHLLESNLEYRKLFFTARDKGREIILDNSVYELGESFDEDVFVGWIKELDPTWYIIPDKIGDGKETIRLFEEFTSKHNIHELPSAIAVAHGKTPAEFLNVFEYFHNHENVDMIGIPFIQDFYVNRNYSKGTLFDQMIGRIQMMIALNALYEAGHYWKPVHMLGSTLPSEGLSYEGMDFIYSTDTSNPVMAGLELRRYDPYFGVETKSNIKMHTVIDNLVSTEQLDVIIENIKIFRRLWTI